MPWYGHNMGYIETRDYYYLKYKIAFGDFEFSKIKMKVYNSDIINKFIDKCKTQGLQPNQFTLIKQIQVAKAFWLTFDLNKIGLAALVLLDRWQNEVNSIRHVSSEDDLVDGVERLTAKIENMITDGTFKVD